MSETKNEGLTPEQRHLGWAISVVISGAMVRMSHWRPGTYWALSDGGTVVSFSPDGVQRSVCLDAFNGMIEFYIYNPEEERRDLDARIENLEKRLDKVSSALHEHISYLEKGPTRGQHGIVAGADMFKF